MILCINNAIRSICMEVHEQKENNKIYNNLLCSLTHVFASLQIAVHSVSTINIFKF